MMCREVRNIKKIEQIMSRMFQNDNEDEKQENRGLVTGL